MLKIRTIAIAAILAVVGFTAFSGTSDAVASGQNMTSKISAHQAALKAAMDDAQ